MVAAGAETVDTLQTGSQTLTVKSRSGVVQRDGQTTQRPRGKAHPELDDFLAQVRREGIVPNSLGLFSAHQMGSCRMGHSATTSVLDEDGEAWDADGLFVFDDSTFPTASGANPMVTTLAISHMLSARLARRLAAPDEVACVARATRRATARNVRDRTEQWSRALKLRSNVQLIVAVLASALLWQLAEAWWAR